MKNATATNRTEKELNGLTIEGLKDLLRSKKLMVGGNKPQLITRLLNSNESKASVESAVEISLETPVEVKTEKVTETKKEKSASKKTKYYFGDTRLITKKSRTPRMTGKGWKEITLNVDGKDIDASVDESKGKFVYFQTNSVWYKIKMQSTTKSEAKGIKYNLTTNTVDGLRITTK